MTIYLRILRYVRHYWPHLTASLICIFLFTLFSSATLVSAIPLLKIIFNPEQQLQTEVSQPAESETALKNRQTIFPDFDKARLQIER